MACIDEEPSSKRSRWEEGQEKATNVREIKLNMDKYDSACQEYSDDDLVQIFELGLRVKLSASSYQKCSDDDLVAIFELGLRVKESVSLTVDVKSNFKDALDSHTKQVQECVKRMEENANKQVRTVEENATGQMQLVEQNVKKEVDKQMQLVLERPKVKGTVGEREVINILKDRFPNFTVTDVSTKPRSGDILVETTRQHKIMIEVKNRETSNVPQKEIDRFISDLANSSHVKVGILFSMKSGIANKASNGRFQVKFDEVNNQYQIYVPNAGKEEDLIVWNVLLADELAQALHGELRASQVQNLQQLYEEFKESKENEKACRSNLESLGKTAKSLEENLNFVLKTVNTTRDKLKKLLDPNATAV